MPDRAPLPAPEQVCDAMIARCRREVEGHWKAALRRLLLPWLRSRLRLSELGEGFHWGRAITVGRGSRVGAMPTWARASLARDRSWSATCA
jgi:hypothetical protein